MKVFITGGTGFVGGRVAVALAQRGDYVTILARSPNSKFSNYPNIKFVRGDLGQLGAAAKSYLTSMDGVIHCGAHVTPFGDWADFERINIHGTKELLDAAISCGVKSFVNFSTPSVYVDFKDRQGIKESDPLPLQQVSMYGKSKVIADELVMDAARHGLNACSLRPRAVIGAGDRNILPRMIKIGGIGIFPLVRGGEAFIDATVIDNVVEATVAALDRGSLVRGEIFNISNGEPISMKDLAHQLFQQLGMDVSYKNIPWPFAKITAQSAELWFRLFKPGVEPPISVYSIGLTSFSQTLDISKAKDLLGYRPKISNEEGIRQFVEWWKTQLTNPA
jgi:nucleoside-diphosphate-sugar epimerase